MAWRPCATIVAEMEQFIGKIREMQKSGRLMRVLVKQAMRQYDQVLCKAEVFDNSGVRREIFVRLNLCELVERSGADPRVEILCDPANRKDGITVDEFHKLYPELAILPQGMWAIKDSAV
jgi:hypothetical protein